MPSAARSLLLLLLTLGCAAVGAAPAPTNPPPTYVDLLPESHPHRRILQQLANLPADQAKTLDAWLAKPEGDAPPGADALIAAAAEHFRSSSVATSAENLWPYETSSVQESPILRFQPIRHLARLGKVAARNLPPDEAVTIALGMNALGRGLRNSDGPLVHGMIGLVIEETGRSVIAARLGDLALADLERYLAAQSSLPASVDDQRFFAGELRFAVRNIERYLLPELLKLSRMTEDEFDGATSFSRDLRLSGVLEMGDGEKWIMLEKAGEGRSLRLKEGETGEGLTVVSIDIPARRAVLRHDHGEIVANLQDKTLSDAKPALASLENYLAFSQAGDTPEKRGKILRELWLRLRKEPDGVAVFLAEQIDLLEQGAAGIFAAARSTSPSKSYDWPGKERLSPFVSSSLDAFGGLARNIHEYDTRERMLAAAIALRKAELTGAAPSSGSLVDPWSENAASSFQLEKSPDGAFTLRSTFERKDGKPLTYKFGAGDAGPK